MDGYDQYWEVIIGCLMVGQLEIFGTMWNGNTLGPARAVD